MTPFNEANVEQAALEWLRELGWRVLDGPSIAVGQPNAERSDPHYQDVVLQRRLRDALHALNLTIPSEALEDAVRKLTVPDSASLVANNHALHRMLVEGIPVESAPDNTPAERHGGLSADGRRHAVVRVIDFNNPAANDFVAVSQFTVVEDHHERRADIVLFVNGLPLAVIELKNPADPNATIWSAFNQLQTYKRQIPTLFTYNEALIVSDGVEARIGTITANKEWFLPWRTIEGAELADGRLPQLQVLLKGVFEKRRFMEMIHYFIVFEDTGGGVLQKKMAGYHQYHAVNVALMETVRASRSVSGGVTADGNGAYHARGWVDGKPGDRRVGVVWHTQGSGKSLTMAFYAGRVVQHQMMENPTIVVLTDRLDLDSQLFGTFSRCRELLRQPPVQAESRSHLGELLNTSSGGVVFTTVQKFFPLDNEDKHPLLSDRRNIVVIADEAHRSQYDFIKGYARHMREALPNASFVGFTGTPIELQDKNTRAVFGDYISIYDIERAVLDGATVPIFYEGRLAKLELREEERPRIDPDFEEVTEDEETEQKEKLKTKWAQLEALVGADKRIRLVADDLVKHFEARLDVIDGKAMIVCMSRRICVEMYEALRAIRPDWHHEDDPHGVMKVIMTAGASDPLGWQMHSRTKERREKLAERFKDPKDHFKVAIVRDMWLTGFDAPCLHTMYVDKPMRGHGLMQAIARVNRVFRDKPGGLVVDYLGLAHELKSALAAYTESGGKGQTAINQQEAVDLMLEKYEVCCGIFHGFDWSPWFVGTSQQQVSILPAAQDHVLRQPNGKDRFVKAVSELSKAFALAVPHDEALRVRGDVGFFQAVRAVLVKASGRAGRPAEELDFAIRQIVSRAVASDEVVDIFAAAGLKKPDISILSDEFLAEVRGMPQRNLAVEMLQKLLDGEIRTRGRRNIVRSRTFSEMLEESIRRYQNRAIEAAQVIEELIALAKEMRDSDKRGEALGLTEEEVAFYDALGANDSAVQVLGDPTLRLIAHELLVTVRDNATIDWTMRENVRSRMRVMVKRILRKHGYPPDKQEKATQLVLEQAEVICGEMAG